MKVKKISIGLLLNLGILGLSSAQADVTSNVGGIFFENYLSPNEEDTSSDRILISCDLNTSEEFESFKTSTAEIICDENGTSVTSSLYLINKELKIKVKGELITIGSIIEKRAALFPDLPIEGRIVDDNYVLKIHLYKMNSVKK